MEFKKDKDKDMFFLLNPVLQFIMMDINLWCSRNGMPCVVTDTISTIEDDKKLKRVSSSHREKRAVDLSASGWSLDNINALQNEFNNKYNYYGAISKSTLKSNLVVYHNSGHGWHLHIQIHKRFAN